MKDKEIINIPEIPAALKKNCEQIIEKASVEASNAAVGLGLAQHLLINFPWMDNASVRKAHIRMMMDLGKEFERNISESLAKELLSDYMGEYVGRGAKQFAFSLVPIVKTVVASSSAKEITEKIGWATVARFADIQRSEDEGKRPELLELAAEFIAGNRNVQDEPDYYMDLYGKMERYEKAHKEDGEFHNVFMDFACLN